MLGDQIQVGIHRVVHPRQNSTQRRDLLPAETGCLSQSDPLFDAARMCAVAVMVDDTLTPCAAKCRILTSRENDRVLDWNDALVVVAVVRQGLMLPASDIAFVYYMVVWLGVCVG